MKKAIKGILFDFNGTMVFDGPEHKLAWDAFSRKYRNCPIQDEELDQIHGKTNNAILGMLLKEEISDEEKEKFSKEKEALYRKICKEQKEAYHFVDGLTDFLKECNTLKIPMTICSASIKENMAFFIDHFQLNQFFDVSTIVYDDGTHDNKISMFQKGANNLHIPVEECLIIEDSLSGLHYADQVNAKGILAITTPDKIESYQRLPGVDKVILDYKNLHILDFYTLK